MALCQEVLFMSDTSGQVQCVDPRIGTTFIVYRGATSAQKNSLSVVGGEYLIVAEANKPILTVWPMNSQEPLSGPKLVLAGKATALATSPDGIHTVVAIDSNIYVYQNSSGALFGVLKKHYRSIAKLLFLDDNAHFVSCGENGAVFVWSLATSLSGSKSAADELMGCEPLYSFSHHSLPVTDAYAGVGGLKSRLYTCSLDQTVKVYGLRNGMLLLSVAFEQSLTALRPNCIETSLYLGTTNGNILEYSLDPLPRVLEYQSQDVDMRKPLEGHKKAVTSLATSIDGHLLVSGGDDSTVIIWDVPSRQLLRQFNMKGTVSSIMLTLAVDNLFSNNFKPQVAFQNFQRVRGEADSFCINVMVTDNLSPIDYGLPERGETITVRTESSEDVQQLKDKLDDALQKNKALYKFAMEKIYKSAINYNDAHIDKNSTEQ